MVSLPDGEKNSKISLFVLAQLRNVTDKRTPGDSIYRAYAYASRGKNRHFKQTILCLPDPSQHVPIYLQQFPSYLNRKCKKSPFERTAAHIFVSPGDAPATIMQYAAWIQR